MQRTLIITVNCALLALLLIGLPTASRAQLWNIQFSSASTGRLLMFSGLGMAAAANIFAALIFIKGRPQKKGLLGMGDYFRRFTAGILWVHARLF